MLILPLHKKPSRENLPVITLVLVLANLASFAFLQAGDSEVEVRAVRAYVDSGVLEREWEWFHEWAEFSNYAGPAPGEIDGMFGEPGSDDRADQIRLMLIENEPAFRQAVEAGSFVSTESPEYEQWEAARQALHDNRRESFTRSYKLRYDELNPVTALSHMFLHGGTAHLVGNMIFLVLLGLLIEPALGGGRLLVLYLVSGIGAGAASVGLNWGADTGGIGASGAIAGLMGLFAVVYGMRRVRFFYWAFVYFDYARAPALVLLPLWLGWEVFAFLMDDGGNIAYEAHIGGLLCGAGLGLLATRTGQVDAAYLDADEHLESDREAVRKAEQKLKNLDAPAAKRLLRPLLARHGQDARLWRLYFAACRLRVDDPEFHPTARRILQLPGTSPEQRALVTETFDQYRKASGGRIKLPLEAAARLAGNLAAWGDVSSARFLVDRMAHSNMPIPGLAQACQTIAARLRAGTPEADQAAYYEQLAARLSDTS